jgi:putative oxidoreductase
MLGKWFAGKQDWAPLPLRLSLGIVFFAHGAQKVFVWFGGYGWSGTMKYFTHTLHIPAPVAVLVFLTELLGGIALFFGVITRWAALFIAGEMAIAALLFHVRNGFFLNWSNAPNIGHGFEYNLALVGAALALVIAGGGRLSVDGLLKKRAR